jgi:hypothetical protein
MQDAATHLRDLRKISDEEVRAVPTTEYHRYYWMDANQVPESLRGEGNIKDGRLRSDYESACDDIDTYWREYKAEAHEADRRFIRQCKQMSNRDSIAKILVDLKTPVRSEAAAAYEKKTTHCDNQYHIRSNPISQFAQQWRAQQGIMRK